MKENLEKERKKEELNKFCKNTIACTISMNT